MKKPKGTAHATLSKFYRSRSNYFHISAPIIRNPLAAMAEAAGEFFAGSQFLEGKGITYKKSRKVVY